MQEHYTSAYATSKSGSISVDQALKKGRRHLVWLPLGIMFGSIILGFVITILKLAPEWIIAIGFLAGFVGAYLAWMILVPKWKVWAFGNVRNVRELRSRAIMNMMIWPEDSFFSKFEIWSAEDKNAWLQIKEKFKTEDEFHDDPSVPAETHIHYSRVSAYILLPMCIGAGYFGYEALMYGSNKGRGYVFCAFAVIFLIVELRKLLLKKPRLTLSNKGIEAAKVPFAPWNEVYGDTIVREGFGKNMKYYLVYNHKGGQAKINIGDYGITRDKLHSLLILYRQRFNAQNRQ